MLLEDGKTFIFKEHLNCVFPFVLVPSLKVLALCEIDFHIWNFKSNGFIRISSKQQVLVFVIGRLNFLLVAAHYAIARLSFGVGLWVLNFKEKTLLACLRVFLLDDSISRSTNLGILPLGQSDLRLRKIRIVLLLSKLPSMQVSLMFLSCSMCQV